MASEPCSYCRGVRLVGWSGAGPILCPECSRDQDAFTVITQAWREQRTEVARLSAELSAAREMREVLSALPKCPLCGEPADNGVCTPDCRLARLIGGDRG